MSTFNRTNLKTSVFTGSILSKKDPVFITLVENKKTYQVNISIIEKLSGLKFSNAIDSYKDKRNIKLVLQDIQN